MINVRILKEDNFIKEITIDGHANYSSEGNDIVCAGVSAISFGIVNSIDVLDTDVIFDISMNEDETGHLTYRSIKSTDKEQLLLESLIISLKTIEENYSEFINIEIREVK